ncbi:hypothetical protein CVT25_001534 [Psilocybe cyanescens]|uniref:Uncharacterized protein n=1 Tax=Psilocybe cyanescens TaxID=93625 RepID=A0A409VUQ6_PSICY|nr:hypothetical protein CVT25_001534 [Psilocybe cyanescens]
MQAGIKNRPVVPLELLDEIIKWAVIAPGKPVLRTLCLSSRVLRAVAQPLLLEHIHIGTPTVPPAKRLAQLNTLASGNCLASKFARTIVIDYSGSFKDPTSVLTRLEIGMHKNLTRALESFKRVEKVMLCIEWLEKFRPPDYRYHTFHSSRTFSKIVQDLVSQSLHLVCLDVNATRDSDTISDLIHSLPASVEHIGLVGSHQSEEIQQDVLLALARLRSLKSISLNINLRIWFRYEDQSAIWIPWSIFKKEGVKLSRIYTDTRMDARFISYLESYTNLQHLVLELRSFGPHRPQNGPPDLSSPTDLLTALSTHHAHSLVGLGLRAHNTREAWSWPFDEEVKELLLLLSKLEYIELSTYGSSENDIVSQVFVVFAHRTEAHVPQDSLLSFCENGFRSLAQLTLDGPWLEMSGYHQLDDDLPFFHRDKSYPTHETSSSSRAITAYQSKCTSGRQPFMVVLGTSTYARRINPETGDYGYVNLDE